MPTTTLPPLARLRLAAWLLALVMACTPAARVVADERTGAQIYQAQCARCHGPAGEGTPKEYPRPLVGNRSVNQLAKYIAKSMPDDRPGTCVGPDADKVSAYIHEAFYSPT